MNVFVEAASLVAIAYATFAVVSFLEIKNKYQPLESEEERLLQGSYRDVGRDYYTTQKGRGAEETLDDTASTSTGKKSNKNNKKKKLRKGRKSTTASAVCRSKREGQPRAFAVSTGYPRHHCTRRGFVTITSSARIPLHI